MLGSFQSLLLTEIEKIVDEVTQVRHILHQNPELAYNEFRTSELIIDFLNDIPDITIIKGLARGTGVAAKLTGTASSASDKCIALRADIDALPIVEETGLPYASRFHGRMHACGHDGHTASLLGAVLVLSRLRHCFSGSILFLFQPAEEGNAGAKIICDEKLLEQHDVSAIYGMHCWPGVKEGVVQLREGPFMASSDEFTLKVKGKGGHAAAPHIANDPIAAACYLVTILQTIVSRSTNPLESVVVGVSQFNAGTAGNIIPDQVVLKGTVRTLSPDLRNKVCRQIEQIVENWSNTFGVKYSLNWRPDGYPVLVNTANEVKTVTETFLSFYPGSKLVCPASPVMAGEDFAFYLETIPGCYWFMGNDPDSASEPQPFLHTSKFNFNDAILQDAIVMHCGIALYELLNH